MKMIMTTSSAAWCGPKARQFALWTMSHEHSHEVDYCYNNRDYNYKFDSVGWEAVGMKRPARKFFAGAQAKLENFHGCVKV